jgi:hypothetical protein
MGELKPPPAYVARCLADVCPEPINWLWRQRFALGKINVLAGQPGLGKTQLAAYMTGCVTTGRPWADGASCPRGSTIFIGCEDDAADTVRPRLDAAGADPSRVHILDWIEEMDIDGVPYRRLFDVQRDTDVLAAMARAIGDVGLIVIDPVSAYLGTMDSHKNAEVQAALAPLQTLAHELKACVILITHLNKGGGDGAAITRVSGSGAFVAAARSAWFVAKHPEDDSRRILTPLKNNIGNDLEGFSYRIEAVALPGGIETSRVVLEADPIKIRAEDALEASRESSGDGSKLAEAMTFLRVELERGPVSVKQLQKAADGAGISWRTVETAKQRLRVRAEKAGFSGGWVWVLPPDGVKGHGWFDVEDREGREDRKAAHTGEVRGLRGVFGQVRNEGTSENLCGLRGLRGNSAAFDDGDIEEGRL